jgi:carbonic anhydrase/acetyltransferase-like protein (isoleucine patch superfamily)
MISEYGGKFPEIHPTCFVAESADVIGDVKIGEHSSVWFQCVVRGDVNSIRIGKYTNVQDGTTLHVTHDRCPLDIGDFVTIGHGAILHGCTVRSYALIGIRAILLDEVEIGEHSIIAAGSLVPEGRVIPPRSLAMGAPARIVRQLTDDEITSIGEFADNYYHYKENYKKKTAEGEKR